MHERPVVLAVDEDTKVLGALAELLQAHGYAVHTATTAAQALDVAKERAADLVLLSLRLAGQDGRKLLTELRERHPATPVILMANAAETSAVAVALQQGAFDYIVSPYPPEELLNRAANALRQKSLEEDFHTVARRLRMSQTNYQYLVQSSPDIIYTLDAQGRFTFVSRAVEDILGYWPSELLGRSYREIVHPDDLAAAEHRFNERRSEQRDGSVHEIRLLRSARAGEGDRTAYAEIKAKGTWGDGSSQGPGPEGRCTFQGTYGVARDNTRRRLAEVELRRQQVFFRQLFDNSPEAIAIVDNAEVIQEVNRSFHQMFQYDPAEATGRNLNDLIVEPERAGEAAGLSRVVRECGLVRADTVRRRKDGTTVEVSLSAYPIELEGDQTGMYASYEDITAKMDAERAARQALARMRGAMSAVIRVIASTVEARDPYTAGHQQRVSNLARAMAQKMDLPPDVIDGLRMAGAIHDVGKIRIPAEILSNPAVITDAEFSLIKIHPKVAYDILKNVDFDWPVADVVYQHHERMDGSGYPQGLKGTEIRIEARILTVADVVDAIASHRPYRPALGLEAALREIEDSRGQRYDATAVDACLELFRKDGFRFHADA